MGATLPGPSRLGRSRDAGVQLLSPLGLERPSFSPRSLVQPRQEPQLPAAAAPSSSPQPSPSVPLVPANPLIPGAATPAPTPQTAGKEPAALPSLSSSAVGSLPASPVPSLNVTMSLSANSTLLPITSEATPSSASNISWSLTASGSGSTSQASKTSSASAASETTFVPGIVFDLHLAGTSETQAVYSVPITLGHDAGDGFRRKRDGTKVLNMQVDLGSSDMWAAVESCKSSDCKAASKLFDNDDSLSPDDPMRLTFSYVSGSVSGNINWEQLSIGQFNIGHQAFLAADVVLNEDLEGGEFQGLLGLALPANSIIENAIPGTTGSRPDGATFLDNLFGAGSSAPSQRLFSLALERREDSRTRSSLGIGAVDERLCPLPCSPNFIPIIPNSNLGRTGYLHWRVPVMGIKAYKFTNEADGTGISNVTIPLPRSIVEPGRRTPLAILDSGGVQILVNSRAYADSIYGAYGISAHADGVYRMPCTQQLSYSFIVGTDEYPVHPLDMSWPDPSDDSRQTCIGGIQVTNNLGSMGDMVLGSAFLKNVYSVYKYPDQKTSKSWQPTVGMKSTTNRSVASSDFYAVRNHRLSLSTVSANGAADANPSSPTSGAAASAQHRVASTAIIAASSVVGFFVLAACAFGAWWYFHRRKVGDDGVVEYKMADSKEADPEVGTGRHRAANSVSTMRSKKHVDTQRQRSMVEGYSDFDIDSNPPATEFGGSIGNLQEIVKEDNRRIRAASGLSSHTRGSSLHTSLLAADHGMPTTPMSDFSPRDCRSSADMTAFPVPSHERRLSTNTTHERRLSGDTGQGNGSQGSSRLQVSSPSSTARLIDMQDSPPTSPPGSRFPTVSSGTSLHSPAMSMSGPFPGSRQSRAPELEEYFPVLPPATPQEMDRARRPSKSSALSFTR